jgi:hypothetical protein
MTNGLGILDVQALLVDPQNSSNVYAGAGGFFDASPSLFKSTNGGASWTLSSSGLAPLPVVALAANSSAIYAIVGDLGEAATLYYSTNGGGKWSQLLEAEGLKFTALALAASSSSPALTLARAGSSDNVSWPASFAGYVLQTTPALNPANWQNAPQPPATNNGSIVVTVPTSGAQGYYRLLLTNSAVASPPTLYLGTDSASAEGVLQSTDGGVSWNAVGLAGNTVNAVAVNPLNPATVYAGLNGGNDAFISTFTPSGQLYLSTYLGGSGASQGSAVAVDFTEVYVVGSTFSSDFPTTPGPAVAQPQDLTPPLGAATTVDDCTFTTIVGLDCPDEIVVLESAPGVAKIGVNWGNSDGNPAFGYVVLKSPNGGTVVGTTTLLSGALPPGFSLGGTLGNVIEGTAKGPAGSVSFTVQVSYQRCVYTAALTMYVSD